MKKSNSSAKKTGLNSDQKLFILIIFIAVVVTLVAYFYKPSFETIKDSIVKIEIYDENNDLLATGSGFCAYESNYIITNYHVIEGAYSIKVITDNNQQYDTNSILIFNTSDDLAILDTTANLKPLTLGNTKALKSGDKISTIGSPLGELNTVSNGIISNPNNPKGIQISSPISHGSSGGVLLDKKNRVIGITYASLEEGNNLNYAIKVDKLKEMKKALDEGNFEQLDVSTYYELTDECVYDSNLTLSRAMSDFEIIKIENNHTFSLQYSGYYSSNNMMIFYEKTNPNRIFERIIKYKSSVCSAYKALTSNDKKLVVKAYEEIIKKDYDMTNYSIKSNINSWDLIDFLIRLDVLSKSELAVVMVDLSNTSDNLIFNKVNSYSFLVEQKILIYYLNGSISWHNISSKNKRQLFDYFNSKGYKTEDLGAILEKLGYTIRYNNNGTLTAYW